MAASCVRKESAVMSSAALLINSVFTLVRRAVGYEMMGE